MQVFQIPHSTGEEQRFIAEFRCRKGDIVVFNHLFRLISHYLQTCDALHVITGVPEAEAMISTESILSLPTSSDHVWSNTQPLIDMVINDACQIHQAEAITAFLAIANANYAAAMVIRAALIEHPHVFQGFLASDKFEISYPATCLAIQLRNLYSAPITV